MRNSFNYRYVDDKGQPLPASEPEYPYVKSSGEFKMMPIRMSLVMDERSLPKLLVECGNSNMPIEVRRVRILKTQDPPADLGSPAPRGARVARWAAWAGEAAAAIGRRSPDRTVPWLAPPADREARQIKRPDRLTSP